MGTVSSGKSPLLEAKMPFENYYNETTNNRENDYLIPIKDLPAGTLEKPVDARVTNATYFASITKQIDANGNISYTNMSQSEVQANRQLIKEHVKNKGPLTASLNFAGTGSEYYNPTTGAYFFDNASEAQNHDVTIVGWDDNYAIANFNVAHKPKTPGAYIALNSFGSNSGDKGYIYISYEDVFIETNLGGINQLEEYASNSEIPYDKLYQYDELGYTFELASTTPILMAANIFQRDDSKIEYVNEVGIFLPRTEGVEVYINEANGNMNNLKKVAVETENITPGYHIIKLATPIELTGNQFVIAIKYINEESGADIPLEANWKDSGISNESNITDTAKANEGESYISLDEGNSWLDINNLKINDTITMRNTNNCIKAYTTISERPSTTPVTGVTLNKVATTIKEGETETLVATILPADATNKNIIWETSDATIASIENGVITGNAKGIATITVTTEDGNHTANCQVTVEEREEEPTIIEVTGITVNPQTLELKEGETATIVATIEPSNATNKNLTWLSTNEEVATIENGVITALEEGETTIEAVTEDGSYTANCQVIVKAEEPEKPTTVKVTGITLNKKSMEMEVGDSGNLVATITPTNATNKEVKWKSKDETIAQVSETGIIKALKEGTTTISVTSVDGNHTAECSITVSKKKNTDDDIYQDKDDNKKPNGGSNINNQQNTIKGDNTIANTKIPYAGSKTILIIGLVIAIMLTIIIWAKVRKLKDVK